MPRRGLVAAPDGWVQIIRGPRPPSVKWPAASEGSGTTKKQGVVGVPRSQARGRWRQPFAQVSSEVSFEAAQRRVAQLESALRALGDAKGPEVTVLQESLKASKRAAQVPPVKVQLVHCEQFVARAEKRLAIHDEERITLVKQLEDGKQRLLKLREEVSQSPAPAPAPVQPTDWGAQVASLQQMLNTLQSERDALAAQIQGEKADVLSHGIVARRRAPQGVGPGQTGGFEGRFCQGRRHRGSRIDFKDGTRCRAVDSVDTSGWNDRRRARVAVNAKYGLRGVRVGEASNPGPKKRRRRVTSSPDPTDSDRTAFLDGFEQDLCHVVQERRGTQLAPTVIQVEESGKVSQLVVDMSVDDSVDEESEGVTHVQPARRRLVLVSTQVESTRPTVEDVDCPGSETESVGSLKDDDHSVQGSLSEVNSEEDGPDLRIGGVKARQISGGMESMDEVILGDILKIRASVMKTVPKFVRGPFRMACRAAFDHHATSMARGDRLGQVRAWKLFLMLPRMLLKGVVKCRGRSCRTDSPHLPEASGPNWLRPVWIGHN